MSGYEQYYAHQSQVKAKTEKDYPLFLLWSLTDDGIRGMIITLSIKVYISNIHI